MWLVSFVLIINMCKCGWLCLLIVNWSSSNFGHALKILNLRLNNVQVSITCVILLAWRRINLDLILFSLLSLHHRSTLLCTPEVMYLGHVTSNSRRTETETETYQRTFSYWICTFTLFCWNGTWEHTPVNTSDSISGLIYCVILHIYTNRYKCEGVQWTLFTLCWWNVWQQN